MAMAMALALALELGGAGVPDSARVPRAQQPAGFRSLRLDLAAPGTPAPPWLGKMSLRQAAPRHSQSRWGRQGWPVPTARWLWSSRWCRA